MYLRTGTRMHTVTLQKAKKENKNLRVFDESGQDSILFCFIGIESILGI